MPTNSKTPFQWLWTSSYFAIGAVLLTYIVFRAIKVPLYSDEIFTYQYYVSIGDFIPFHARLDANNHVLHSLLMYLSVNLFGDHIWAWRLPNILAFVLYYYFIIKLTKGFKSAWVKWFTILGLTAPLYLLQFFSLARGYGLSLAFLLGAIYFLSRKTSKNNLLYFLLLASCTVWSNLGILIPIGILTVWNLLRHKNLILKWSFWKQSPRLSIIISTIFVLLALAPVYAILLQKKGALYLGKDLTFLETFSGLGNKLFPLYLRNREWILSVIGILALPWNLLIAENRNGLRLAISLALWGTVLSLLTLKNGFDINYPVARSALHFYPLFVISIAINMQALPRYVKWAPALLGIGVFAYQLHSEFNIHYAPEWRKLTLTDTFYQQLEKWQNENNRSPTVSGSKFLGMLLEEQDRRRNWQLNSFQRCGQKATVTDFLLLNNWTRNTMGYAYDTMYRDARTSVTLLKRTNLLEWKSLQKTSLRKLNDKKQFILIDKLEERAIDEDTLGIDLTMTFEHGSFPHKPKILIETVDSSGKKSRIEEILLWAPLANAKTDVLFKRRVALPPIPNNQNVFVYLFQEKENETTVRHINVEWYNLTEP